MSSRSLKKSHGQRSAEDHSYQLVSMVSSEFRADEGTRHQAADKKGPLDKIREAILTGENLQVENAVFGEGGIEELPIVSGWKEIDVCIFGPVEDPAHMIGHRIFIVGRRDKSRDSGRAQDNSQVDSDHHCETIRPVGAQFLFPDS